VTTQQFYCGKCHLGITVDDEYCSHCNGTGRIPKHVAQADRVTLLCEVIGGDISNFDVFRPPSMSDKEFIQLSRWEKTGRVANELRNLSDEVLEVLCNLIGIGESRPVPVQDSQSIPPLESK